MMTGLERLPSQTAAMKKRHCLVTGANRGIGLEFVRQLLARGDRVIATCRKPGAAGALNALVGAHPGRLHVLPLDVADPKSQAALASELPLVLDDGRVDLLVNNAGVLHSGERFGKVTLDLLDDSFRTNAAGPFLLAQALAPLLADGARIANLSSELGSIADAGRYGTPSYCISKAAQNMASVLLSHALRERGIVVLALHPGWAQTDMGGPQSTVPASESVEGLLRVIDGAREHDSGTFRDWTGTLLPW
jgi:NAD(P)-dependent dehydrogenase (short-subunit alcohol dehydrogenase family)